MKSNIAAWMIAAGLVLSAIGLAAQDQDKSTTTQQQTTTSATTNSTTNSTDNSATPQNNSNPGLPDKDSAATPSPGAAVPPETSATATQDTSDRSANVRTLTGCLQKADGADEYQLTGHDGSTWELRSDAVDLASHVGHTVTITGAVRNAEMHGMKEDMKKEAQEHGMDNSATEHGHMTVTNLTMVSTTCSQ